MSAASSVDLPAFGAPTRPMSAMSFSSSSTQRSSPGVPFSAWRRRAVGRRREARVAAAAATAAGDDEAGIGLEQLADPVAVGMGADHRPGRDANDDVRGAAAVRLAPGAAAARVGAEVAPALEVAEGRLPGLDRPGSRRRPCPRRRRRGLRAERAPRDGTCSRRRPPAPAGNEDARAVSEAGHQERSIRVRRAPEALWRDAGVADRR